MYKENVKQRTALFFEVVAVKCYFLSCLMNIIETFIIINLHETFSMNGSLSSIVQIAERTS